MEKPTVASKQKRKNDQQLNTFMATCTDALKSQIDEYEAIGLNVAAKLRKMDANQAILAESVINKVLYKGMFKQLTTVTDLTERVTHFEYTQPIPITPITPIIVQSPLSSNSSTTINDYYENIGQAMSTNEESSDV